MTSFLTTGGIRGGSEKINKFQPRSLIWVCLESFEASKGFGNIHPGEDPTYRYGFGSSFLNQTVSKCVCIS
jgi:hypothetical protein